MFNFIRRLLPFLAWDCPHRVGCVFKSQCNDITFANSELANAAVDMMVTQGSGLK